MSGKSVGTMSVLLFVFQLFSTPSFAAEQTHIVFISDSHGLGAFGDKIRDWLAYRPSTTFTFVASGGSAPLQWTNDAFETTCGIFEDSFSHPAQNWTGCKKMHTPDIHSLWMQNASHLNRDTRTITIIALGTNFSISPGRAKSHEAETQELVKAALYQSETCIWIGPPNMRRSPGFDAEGVEKKYQILKKGTQGCTLIDSRALSKYPENTGDGIHYQWPGSQNLSQIYAARSWASKVITKIEELLK